MGWYAAVYGNDGENYRTIAKTQDITAAQEKKLLSGYLGYEFVRDMNLYSSVAKEPIAFTYVTTSLSGQWGKNFIGKECPNDELCDTFQLCTFSIF